MEFEIPPLPDTLGEILQVMSSPPSTEDIDHLIDVISKDPATSIHVLRRVNSPYYGLRRYISQIDQAIVLLGFKRVCNLVLTATLKKTFAYLESTAAQNVYEYVMRSSLATAAFARDLAIHLQMPFAETSFTAGLLHQLGRLVLLQSATQLYTSLWYEQVPGSTHLLFTPPSPEKERNTFKTDYPALGASIMRKWAFPEPLVAVTQAVLTPSQVINGQMRTLTLTVAAGRVVSERLFGQNGEDTGTKGASAIPIPVILLARDSNLDATALASFLNQRSEAVRAFAEQIFEEV